MSRVKELFKKKKRDILNIYCTAGYPFLQSTLEVMKALQENGADMVELGMPYSDPLADGPVIQSSNAIAINNGMTIEILFHQLKDFRKEITIPVILMGYMNPILQYGFEEFCKKCKSTGIDGLIIPDLPEFEFDNEYASILKKYELDFIFLITPETSEERVRLLDTSSSGFIYAVSSSSTTGSGKNMLSVGEFLKKLKGYNLTNPVLVGFGIKDRETFRKACEHASGAIIGTAYINALASKGNVAAKTKEFLTSIMK